MDSWHKTLKSQYLGGERNLRADDLLFLLQGVVDIDFRTRYFKRINNLIPLKLSAYNMKERSIATDMNFDVALTMIVPKIDEQKVPKISVISIILSPKSNVN